MGLCGGAGIGERIEIAAGARMSDLGLLAGASARAYDSGMPPNEILIEIQRFGAILRVAAMDVATGAEVIFQAPATASRVAIHRLAASKLRYVLTKATTAKSSDPDP